MLAGVLSSIGTDFRLAARRLLAAPLFGTFAVLSLAVGVGVTTVACAVVADVFFPRLGIPNADRVVTLMAPRSGVLSPALITAADFEQLRREPRSLAALAASSRSSTTLAGPQRTSPVAAEAVSGDYFSTMGIAAALGRTIQPDDERSRAPVAVLSHAAWRDRFASDPAIIGRVVRIGGQPFEIIGVAPSYFTDTANALLNGGTSVWVPLGSDGSFTPRGRAPTPRNDQPQLAIFGRVRPSSGVEGAAADLAAAGAALDASNPLSATVQGAPRVAPRGWTARALADVHAERTANIRRLGTVVAGFVLLVLAVACTNLANLVLARGTNRQQDFVIRRALGAGQWRLVREQLAESLIIAAVGGAASYVVMLLTAAAATRDLPLFADLTLSIRPQVDSSAVAVAACALMLALLVSGLEPALRLARASDVRGPLAAAAARMGRTGRYRTLLRWQVAVSAAFFILAAIALRYVAAELGHDPGVRLDGLVVAQLEFDTPGWDDERIQRALRQVADEAQRSPVIAAAAISTGLPFGTATPQVRISAPSGTGGVPGGTAALVAATPNVFSVAGLRIVRGRPFDDRDRSGTAPVVVVSETGARSLFGTIDVVGRELSLQLVERDSARSETVTIAGVAADTDTRFYMTGRGGAVVYAPLAQQFARPITVVARAAGSDKAAIEGVHAAVRRADPDIAVAAIGNGWDMLAGPLTLAWFASTASLSLGALTLVLAMAGLYGIQSQGVTLRTREIGVRLSFGATAGQIERMVLKDGYRPVLEGMVLGLAGGISARVMIRAYLDVPLAILDPWMLALVPVPLVLAAFCACYLPARRASRVDPNVALRDL